MSHQRKLREDKRCENCGHFVEKRFCPQCGQENIETRQSFFHLFKHFLEDFVHYDGKFWKTIRYLLFSPAKLSKEYIAGKRNCYVEPVKLYIFISFIVFFLPAILPYSSEKVKILHETLIEIQSNNDIPDKSPDSEQYSNIGKYKFDRKKIEEEFQHQLPKAIFLYMPVFAFWLWLFHNKKKRFYFDHGIYTLHYFSFILLSISLYILLDWLLFFFHLKIHPSGNAMAILKIHDFIRVVMIGYFIYYFFRSHRLFYQESKAKSRFKCSALFVINTFCMIVFLLLFVGLIMVISSDINVFEALREIRTKI